MIAPSVEKPLIESKFWILSIFGVGLIIGLGIGFIIGSITSEPNTVQVTERPINFDDLVVPTTIPTTVDLAKKYASWQEYLYRDCGIKFYAPPEWIAGLRGSYDACGSLYSEDAVNNFNFDKIDGLKIVMLKIGGGSSYDFPKGFEVAKYLSPKGVEGSEDYILLATDQYGLELYESRHLKLTRDNNIGTTNNLFYKINNNWYVIIWNDIDSNYDDDIKLLLESIRTI